ncbi:DUF4340 domain-containing protein [Hominifimenecus sp. rT4P-3]|uniref:DUF4340 domain-containing protein n=1 Tax=Hominifimenecus sp. rT4P-3 TaxID=3242979 RepID=UPI003DA2ABE8
MKKKKKARSLILLLVLLLAACGGYYALTKYNASQEEAESGKSEENEKLLSLTGGITSLSYEWAGEKVSLSLTDSKWKREGDENYPVNQSSVSSMVSTLKAAEKQKEIPGAADALGDYGLDAPKARVTIGDDTGASEVFLIGNENPTAGGCYSMAEESGKVYLTDAALATAFDQGWAELLAIDDGPGIGSTKVREITVEAGGETKRLKYEPAGLPEYDYTEKANLFYQKADGTYLPVSSTMQSSILNQISSLSYQSASAYQPTEEEKAIAGLTEPAAVITIRYVEDETVTKKAEKEGEEDTTETVEREKAYVLSIGRYDEEKNQYQAAYQGGSTILTISGDTVRPLLDVDERTIANVSPNEIADTSIDRIDLTYQGEIKTLTIERKEVEEETTGAETEAAEGETEAAATKKEVTYYLDGEEIAAETFQKYQSAFRIEGQRILEEGEALLDVQPEFTVTYHRNTETFPTVTISYIPYNENFYQVAVNGAMPSIVVNIRDVEQLIQLFRDGVTETAE